MSIIVDVGFPTFITVSFYCLHGEWGHLCWGWVEPGGAEDAVAANEASERTVDTEDTQSICQILNYLF